MKIFISYSSSDEEKARAIVSQLQENGFNKEDYWISCDHLNENHMLAIPREIAKADVVLFLVSEHSKDAPGQENEIKQAEAPGVRKPIIPFLLGKVDPQGTWLKWPLTGYQYIKGYEQDGFEKLLTRLSPSKRVDPSDAIPELGNARPVVELTTLSSSSDIMHFSHALKYDRMLRLRRALDELRKISKQDDSFVRYYTLRIRYTLEGGVDEDELEDVFAKACNLGCVDAKVNLASKYLDDWDSKGVANASVNQCMEWLRAAIKEGEPEALVELANAYEEGKHGAPKDKSIVERLYKQAIHAGSLMGRINLGFFYASPYFDNNDDVKSRVMAEEVLRPILMEHLLKNEADADKVVHWIIALAYACGIVVQKDYSLAIYFLKKVISSKGKSLSQDDIVLSTAWYLLGIIYLDQNGGFKNYQEAFKCFTKASEVGTRDGTAENQLGGCYENGIGVDKDENMAMNWYRRAADKGCASALFSLAMDSLSKENTTEGKVQLSQAVEKGDDAAKLVMGLFLCEGAYFTKNETRGMELIKESADSKNAEAMERLGLIFMCGLYGTEKDAKKAEEWLTRAAESGNASAECSLGTRYAEGAFGAADRQKAVYWWNRAAEHGDVDAMYNLGTAYLSEIGVMANPHIAFDWFKKAADQGEVKAMLALGAMCLDSRWDMVDKVQAEKWFKQAAETGDADALNACAVQFYNGSFGDADKPRAIELWKRAADKKCSAAMVCIGECHRDGEGVPADVKQAVQWFERAIELGNTRAMKQLGWTFLKDEGALRNIGRAKSLFEQAAGLGDVEAMCALGMWAVSGMFADADYETALKWYTKAVESGSVDAMEQMGLLYLMEWDGKDLKKAEEWLTRAAESGNASAECSLGTRYAEGAFGAADRQKAVYWWNRAAEHGDVDAMYNLGTAYLSEIGVMANPHIAFDWFKKAADQGEVKAMLALGAMCLDSRWDMVDKVQAEKWFKQAAETGDADALNACAVQFYNGSFGDADKPRAIELWKRAADKKCSAAMVCIGECHRDGEGVPADVKQAVQWFERAIELGNTRAMVGLAEVYLHGNGSIVPNEKKAIELFERAAGAEEADVEALIAWHYMAGDFGTKDCSKAVYWFERAANHGNDMSYVLIGLLYSNEDLANGQVEKDIDKAREAFQKAADRDIGICAYFVANYYIGRLGFEDYRYDEWAYRLRRLYNDIDILNNQMQKAEDIFNATLNICVQSEGDDLIKQLIPITNIEQGCWMGLARIARFRNNRMDAIRLYGVCAEKGHELAVRELREVRFPILHWVNKLILWRKNRAKDQLCSQHKCCK